MRRPVRWSTEALDMLYTYGLTAVKRPCLDGEGLG